MRALSLSCALLLLATATPAIAQDPTRPAIEPHVEMQFQFSTTNVEPGDGVPVAPSTFEFRRVRTYLDVRVNDWITGALEAEIAMGRLSARKVYMDLEFSEAFSLKIGQDKKPFSLLELTSSSKFPMIEQNARIRGADYAMLTADTGGQIITRFDGRPLVPEQQAILDILQYKGYELGVTAHGRVGRFGYDVGMYNGTGIDRLDDNASKSFAGRATYTLPLEKPLTIGVASSYREVSYPFSWDTIYHAIAFEGDVEWGEFRRPGFWILAEGTVGPNIDTDDFFVGATGIATYFVPTKGRVEGIEPVFRAGWADPNDAIGGDEAIVLTPGFNIYFTGRNKLSLNWEVLNPTGSVFKTYHALRAQAQLFM